MGVQYIEGEVVDFVFKEHPEYVSDVLDSVYKGTNELVVIKNVFILLNTLRGFLAKIV